MQILTRAQSEVQPYLQLIDVLEKLRKDKPDVQQVVQALLAYANNPATGDVATIVNALNLNGGKIQQFINANKDKLTLLASNVGDLAGSPLTWSLEDSGAIPAGAFAVDVGANVTATVSGDDDGDLFDDKAVPYDNTTDAYLKFEVNGKVSAGANVPSLPFGQVSGKAAFSADASILAGAYFRHPVNTPAVDAIVADIRRFRLPLDPAPLAPGQVLRLHGEGSVAISGSLSWGKTIVSTGTVSADALNLTATPIEADVALGASVGFDAEVKGFFNLIVSAADDGRRRVQLVQSRTQGGGTTIQAGVGVTIKGIDKVANGLISHITTPLQPLVDLLSKKLDQFGDLHELFTKEVGAAVDQRLQDAAVLTQIQNWLTAIGSDFNLREKLREVLTNAISNAAGSSVDAISTAIQPVIDFVKELIRRYQKALTALNAAVKAMAEVKVGIELTRRQTTTDENKVALSIVIDPQKQPDAYRHLIYGDFTKAIDLARNNDPAVTLEDATWSEKGSTTIATSLNISAFGVNVGAGSLLKQDWQWQLTASGDLNLGVSTSLDAWAQGWRVLRSVTFLADTHVLAVVSSANQLLDPVTHNTAMIDVSERSQKFTRTDLGAWQKKMIDLGVLAAPTTMTDDAVVDPNNSGAKFPYGDLMRTAQIEFTEAEILTIAKSSSFDARKQFATALADYWNGEGPFKIRDDKDTPIAAWQSVQAWALGGRSPSEVPPSLEFADDSGKKHTVVIGTFFLNQAALMVKQFDTMISRLRSLAGNNSLAGATIKDALATIRIEQRRIFDSVKFILTADITKHREDVGFAFFVTMWNLAGKGAVDPFVLLVRDSGQQGKEKRFVYA